MTFKSDELEAFVEAIESFIAHPEVVLSLDNDALRHRLRESGRKLSVSMESPGDTVHRLNSTPLELAAARVGIEAGIFEALVSHSGTMTHAELAASTKVDPVLIKRLLRYYQSREMVSQPEDDAYSANNVTKALTTGFGPPGTSYFFDTVLPSFTALPKFLRETGYKNPTDPNHCPWHLGHDTDLNPFPWLNSRPEKLGTFLAAMTYHRQGQPIFLDAMDFAKYLLHKRTDATTPLFVDIGGAMGHMCIAVKRRFPDLKGRIILQDQPFVIDQVKTNPLPGFEGIEAAVHDFFTPQMIKGACVYYYSHVLHDWPDGKCVEILKNLKGAMTEESYLFIDEIVFSERGAPWRGTSLDMALLTCLAAVERTAAQWEILLGQAGFKIEKIVQYAPDSQEAVIIARPQ